MNIGIARLSEKILTGREPVDSTDSADCPHIFSIVCVHPFDDHILLHINVIPMSLNNDLQYSW